MATNIQLEIIGLNRYAAPESRAINSYSYGGASGLSVGQLMMAVCCRRAAAIEAQSVVKMNNLTSTTTWLKALSAVASQVLGGTAKMSDNADYGDSGYRPRKTSTTSIKDFLINECGVGEDKLSSYENLDNVNACEAVFDLFKSKLDAASTSAQQQTIDLQSLLSRRDVTYSTSATAVKNIMQCALNTAANF